MAFLLKSQRLISTIVIIVCLTIVRQAYGQLTIPRRELGFTYRKDKASCNPPVTLTFFIDNTCPDSQATFPLMLKVADHFGPNQVRLVTHLFSLPYHRNSHTIAKGAHVIEAFSNGTATYPYFQAIFDDINSLTTSATTNMDDSQVLDIIAYIAAKASGISPAQFKSRVAESTVDSNARLDWKYVCTRGVFATPTYMVNDVTVQVDPSWTLEDWIKLIENLLAAH